MRINKYVALSSGLSRRAVDSAISQKRITINDRTALLGQEVDTKDVVRLDGKVLNFPKITTVMLHKPAGFVCSRSGQGSRTIYDLLPSSYHHLKPIGRLDKDSSGLLLLTNDGQLAHELTHPSYRKEKIYEIKLDKPLDPQDKRTIQTGVQLEDGLSRLQIKQAHENQPLIITMSEGRNRQIRRTFAALGYEVKSLHRIQFGNYHLPADLKAGYFRPL